MNDQTVSSSPTDSTPRLIGYGSATSSTASAIAAMDAAVVRAQDAMQRAHDECRTEVFAIVDRAFIKVVIGLAALGIVAFAAIACFG